MTGKADDIFSEGYLEAFYKAHVVSRRSNVDEDIAAIEAEIRKVQKYQSKYRGYLVSDHNLNSCGNSECSDDEEMNPDSKSVGTTPTSVFKVYNSSRPYPASGRCPHPQGLDVFTWSQYQLVTHDHCYVPSGGVGTTTPLDHEGLIVDNINWSQLALTKRTQALKRLSTILRHRPPSLHYSPGHASPSSLTYLPRSLADFVRTNKGVVTGTKPSSNIQKNTAKIASLILAKERLISVSNTTSRAKRKPRPTPYDRVSIQPIEITRIRNSSTCSESEESLEVD